MVEKNIIQKILNRLEKYMIQRNGFRLLGDTYDLILFVPSDKYLSDAKYSLIISAKSLDGLHQKDVIRELLNNFKEVLMFDEYNALSRLNIIHSDDPLVKNLKLVFGFREELIELNEMPIGGVRIDFAYLVKSLVLDKLIENRALAVEVRLENHQSETIKMGIIRIEKNFEVVYYTSKGLRDMMKSDLTDEQKQLADKLKGKSEDFLIENKYIAKVAFENILKVV